MAMANATNLTEMLKQLGWGSGFKLPIANEENRELERILEMKQSKLIRVNTELQETSLTVENSASFLQHLDSKIQHAKDVEAAKRGQMEKEKHFYTLALRDQAKDQQNLKNLQKRVKSMKQRNSTSQRNILRRKEALGELVDTINFDKKAIVEYEHKFSKEDAYMKLMEDFGDVDNEKYAACKKEYQQLGEKIVNSQQQCNQTVMESEILEGELEALAKRFRKAHAERNQFIENWKNTLQALEHRDKEIIEMSFEYKKASLHFRKNSELLEKQEAFYENIKSQTRSCNLEINRIERMVGSLHTRKTQEQSVADELADGIAELASYIFKIEKEIKDLAKQFKSLSSHATEWKQKISKLKGEVESLKAKFDVFSVESMSSSEQVKQLQEFLDTEEKRSDLLMKEFTKQNNYKSQRQRQCLELNNEILSIEAEARNLKSCISQAKRSCGESGDTIMKVKSIAYGLDIQCMNLASKLRGLENPTSMYSMEDYSNLVREISDMKVIYQENIKMGLILKNQTRHCDVVIGNYQKDIVRESEQNSQYDKNLNKLGMEIKRIGKDDDASLEIIKDVGVTNSLLHVQLSKMLHSIKNFEKKMLGLEQERVTLHAVVKSRQKDIETYYALLQGKKRGLQEESQKLRVKLYEVTGEADSKKRKYEMIMIQMWNNTSSSSDGGGGKEESSGKSEAYYIIKIAQEREHYRQEGDKWDERVKEAEKVVTGLQNTLALMMGTNEAFKDSLKPATENTKEGQQLQALKEKEYEAAHKLKLVKERRIIYIDKLKEVQLRLDNSLTEKSQLEYGVMEKQYQLKSFVVEIQGQKEKIRRATLQANKLIKELAKVDTLDRELLQNDLRVRVTREKLEFSVTTLERLLSIYPYLSDTAIQFFAEKGMMVLRDRLLRKLLTPALTPTSQDTSDKSEGSAFSSARSISMAIAGVRRSNRTGGNYDYEKHSHYNQVHQHHQHHQEHDHPSKTSSRLPAARRKQTLVYNAPTASPSTQKLLGSIVKGMEEAKRKAEGKRTQQKQTASTSTGISFGELRKELHDLVSEQQHKHSQLEGLDEEEDVPKASTDIVELVDNKTTFNEATSREYIDEDDV